MPIHRNASRRRCSGPWVDLNSEKITLSIMTRPVGIESTSEDIPNPQDNEILSDITDCFHPFRASLTGVFRSVLYKANVLSSISVSLNG